MFTHWSVTRHITPTPPTTPVELQRLHAQRASPGKFLHARTSRCLKGTVHCLLGQNPFAIEVVLIHAIQSTKLVQQTVYPLLHFGPIDCFHQLRRSPAQSLVCGIYHLLQFPILGSLFYLCFSFYLQRNQVHHCFQACANFAS